MNNNVTIIIPSWNGELLMQKHLPAVYEAFKNKKNNIQEVIIVDDKSSDGSVEYVKNNFPDFKIIKHTQNRGFSATVNTGARSAKSELLCLLNQDVSPSKNFLEDVLKHFSDEKIFAVTLHEKGNGPGIGKYENGFIALKPGRESDAKSVSFWASGGSGVFKRNIWMKLGGMDEKLLSPFYWEDLDLAYRAQKRGYKVVWEPNSYVEHNHESTINLTNFKRRRLNLIKERNQLLVVWKNITSQPMFRKHIRGVFARLVKHPGYARVIFAALLKFGTVTKLRRKEKKESTVSDETIFSRFN
jgi:O-antigen biosynthesis protein